MPLPVLVLRPEPGAAATVSAAQALGMDARAYPLFAVRPCAWEPVAREDIDALLLGSANALRHAGAALERYRGLPAYAVGASTAAAARAAGLDVVAAGEGGLQALLGALRPGHRRLLRLAGRDRVALEIPPGIAVTTREVYATEPLALPAEMAALLAAPALVLLHSGEAAARFAAACDAAGVTRGHLRLAAIGPRVAARAGTGWAMLRSADAPRDAALLALAAQMCQETQSGSPVPEQG